MTVLDRAYSVLNIKSIDDGERTIRGVATAPSPDRMSDVVEPLGVEFKNPMPLLWQHDSHSPVGTVMFDKPTKSGITFVARLPKIEEPGVLKDRIDEAWQSVVAKLVTAVSIGFRAIEYAYIEGTGGIRYIKSEVMELSLVTIPAQPAAVITSIKSMNTAGMAVIKQFDVGAPAAIGTRAVNGGLPPGASGKSSNNPDRPKEGKIMNISAKIAELEGQRKEKALRFEAIQKAALDGNRSKNEQEKTEFDALRTELKELDAEVKDLRDVETLTVVTTAKAVGDEPRGRQGGIAIPAQAKKDVPKLAPGILYTQLVKARTLSRVNIMPLDFVARQMYGEDSLVYGTIIKANEVLPGTAASGNWGYDLISQEGAANGDFVTYLRAQTIVGKFGQGNVPALNGSIRFYEPYVIQTGPGAGFWVGEAKTKPVTSFDFDRSVLTPLKMANISVLSNENIKRSDPKSDVAIRDALVEALVETEDTAFIDPANSGTSNIKPASVTNGADTVAATGTGDADDIVMDLRALFNKFDTANNDPTSGVLIMSPKNARAAGMLLNALGQTQFPTISAMGGSIMSVPVIVSNHAGTNIVMINAKDVYYVDEGFMLDASDQVSLEMRSVPTQDGSVPTMTSMISMWQNNLVAFRAEKTVNWKKRRSTAVAYLTGAAWGGAVPES